MACEGQYVLSLLLSDLCSVSSWRGRRDPQVLVCVLAALISGSETKLLPDHLSERRRGLLSRQNDLTQTLSLQALSAVKRTKGHISHFGQKKKKRFPIILSGLDSPHLFSWCHRLVANRETSHLTLLCALDLLLEHSWLSTTTPLYSML